jgi:hypothetical protein
MVIFFTQADMELGYLTEFVMKYHFHSEFLKAINAK